MTDSQRTNWLATALLCLAPLAVGLDLAIVNFTQVLAADAYWADLFRGFFIVGLAIPVALVPLAIAALAETLDVAASDRRRGQVTRAEGEPPWTP
jgi:hypothetical protein